MKKIVPVIVLLSLFPRLSLAEESAAKDLSAIKVSVQTSESDPGKVISPMMRGQKAPYSGVLLAPASLASVVVELETIPMRIQIEKTKVEKECQATCDKKTSDLTTKFTADKQILQAQIDADKKQAQVDAETIKKLRDGQTNPLLWTGLGAVGGIAVTLLTVFAVSAAKK